MKIRIILLEFASSLHGTPIQRWGLTPSLISTRATAFTTKVILTRLLQIIQKAISIDPKYAEAYYNRGQAYYKKKNMRRRLRITPKALSYSLRMPRYTTAGGLPTSTEGNTTMPLRTQPRPSP